MNTHDTHDPSMPAGDQYHPLDIVIPDDLDFVDLRLHQDDQGYVDLDLATLERICEASEVSVDTLMASEEDRITGLIVCWYATHRANGGAQDAIAEQCKR